MIYVNCARIVALRSSHHNIFLPLCLWAIAMKLTFEKHSLIHFLFSISLILTSDFCNLSQSQGKRSSKTCPPLFFSAAANGVLFLDFCRGQSQWTSRFFVATFRMFPTTTNGAHVARSSGPFFGGYATECAPNAHAKVGEMLQNPGSIRIRKSNQSGSDLICTTPMYSTYPTEKCEATGNWFLDLVSSREKQKVYF